MDMSSMSWNVNAGCDSSHSTARRPRSPIQLPGETYGG